MFHKNSPEILTGYFGKLPEFNDFIKYNAGSPEILYIDNWLQEGLAQAKFRFKEEWKERYDSIPPSVFFIPVPSSQRIVSGMLYPGKDKSGRDFPFIIFSLIAGREFDPFYLMPAELKHNVLALDEILRKEETLNALNTALKNYQASLPLKDLVDKNFQQYLSTSHINEFLSRTGLSNLKEKLKDVKLQDNSVICISFTTDDSHFSYDTGFLINILRNKINLSYKHSSVFWNNKTNDHYQLYIFPFNLTALNFVDLLSSDPHKERLISIECSKNNSVHSEGSNITLGDYLKAL